MIKPNGDGATNTPLPLEAEPGEFPADPLAPALPIRAPNSL